MSLSVDDRLNLTKAWDYLTEDHFKAHAQCLKYRVNYRWLAYYSPTIEDDWKEYKEKLRNEYHVPEETIATQIECRILPFSKDQLPHIPFRITLFGDVISVSFEEPKAHSYHKAVDSVTISQAIPAQANVYRELKKAWEQLYSGCNDIMTYKMLPQNARIAEHAQLRTIFLRALACQDLRLKYEEATAFVSTAVFGITLILLIITITTTVLTLIFHSRP